ncbi:hypothetical protein J3Q64DRAFT_1765215 [Phycomyces blakesleeanus]|uniref:Uncharacterized protein n=2 Tax=Phycomyces blakesleeanus TaxID=4837 RepID=A0A163E295_PHYB8|nr:hypothetical protein PHYBLDRAFT_61198 [Phycomyces blakesleeanus NRRL 1555(-)]OAD74750.1 hypothetical protein PHYBLDRAFT_61198 [Phycomyces blakesleeanus NRRL 1555(-)]|eukprot:XP_018292790.1 hypothetical protein PHYBLDRAFT_61198 [Phycomyces blakesleeanus NRRL 1555(-)]
MPSDNTRLPRHLFRKNAKLNKRKQRRIAEATERNQNTACVEETPEEHSLYLQQQRQWEERERRENRIQMARQKAQELEQKAKANAEQKWKDALLRIPLLPPAFPSTTVPSTAESKLNMGHVPQFISSKDENPPKRRRYKDIQRERNAAAAAANKNNNTTATNTTSTSTITATASATATATTTTTLTIPTETTNSTMITIEESKEAAPVALPRTLIIDDDDDSLEFQGNTRHWP